jgi:transposase
MVQALSNDLRQRIVEDVEGGLSRRGAARKYRVSASCVIKLVKHYSQTGGYAPRPRGGDRRSYLGPYGAFIEGLIRENSSVTLQGIQAQLKARFERTVPVSVLDRFIRKQGWRYKKNGARQRAGA